MTDLPTFDLARLKPIDFASHVAAGDDGHDPRLLLLSGSLRGRSAALDDRYSERVESAVAPAARVRQPEI